MALADASSEMKEPLLYRPLSESFVRWSVPVVYGICVLLIATDLMEFYRRIYLAEDVARVYIEGNPQTIGEFEALVNDHLRERIRDYPSPDNPSHSFRGYQLSPKTWLTLWIEYDSETGNIADAWMIYGGSERVTLDATLDGIPEPPLYPSLAIILVGLVCGLLWLWAVRVTNWTRYAVGAFALLPLLPVALFAVISIARVIM